LKTAAELATPGLKLPRRAEDEEAERQKNEIEVERKKPREELYGPEMTESQ